MSAKITCLLLSIPVAAAAAAGFLAASADSSTPQALFAEPEASEPGPGTPEPAAQRANARAEKMQAARVFDVVSKATSAYP